MAEMNEDKPANCRNTNLKIIVHTLQEEESDLFAVFFKRARKCPQRNPEPDTQMYDLYILSCPLIIYLTAAESG